MSLSLLEREKMREREKERREKERGKRRGSWNGRWEMNTVRGRPFASLLLLTTSVPLPGCMISPIIVSPFCPLLHLRFARQDTAGCHVLFGLMCLIFRPYPWAGCFQGNRS